MNADIFGNVLQSFNFLIKSRSFSSYITDYMNSKDESNAWKQDNIVAFYKLIFTNDYTI